MLNKVLINKLSKLSEYDEDVWLVCEGTCICISISKPGMLKLSFRGEFVYVDENSNIIVSASNWDSSNVRCLIRMLNSIETVIN